MQVAAAAVPGIRDLFDGNLRPSQVVQALTHFDQFLPVRMVARGGRVRELASSRDAFPPIRFTEGGKTCDLNDFLATNRVAGLLVLKDGNIALEVYDLGLAPHTRWASGSMAKSITSTLAGAALRDGHIASLDDPVARYLPALRQGAYGHVSVRQVLSMSSGVRWNEAYTDRESERRKLLEQQLTLQPGGVLRFMSDLSRVGSPGSAWNYNTGESYVLGAVIESATRKSLTAYLSEKIWSRAGMEQDATWWLESPDGMGIGGGGMTATLRDYGRFGQFVVDGGRLDGVQVVPDRWFELAGAPQRINDQTVGYGYGWWIPPQSDPMHLGAFQAEGIYGQYLFVNPRERLVIVLLSARSKPSAASRLEWTDEVFFSAVASALG